MRVRVKVGVRVFVWLGLGVKVNVGVDVADIIGVGDAVGVNSIGDQMRKMSGRGAASKAISAIPEIPITKAFWMLDRVDIHWVIFCHRDGSSPHSIP